MHGYCYSHLSCKEQAVYQKIESAVKTRQSSVLLQASPREVSRIINCFYRECPELFYWNMEDALLCPAGNEPDHPGMCRLTLSYLYNIQSTDWLRQTIEKTVTELFAAIGLNPEDSELAKAGKIHDSLLSRAKIVRIQESSSRESQEIIGPFLYESSSAEGIAKCFCYLCQKAHIDCVLVSGYLNLPGSEAPSPHVWNAVRINDEFYYADITMDSRMAREHLRSTRSFFLVSPQRMHDHTSISSGPEISDHNFDWENDSRFSFEDLHAFEQVVNEGFFDSEYDLCSFKILDLQPAESILEKVRDIIMSRMNHLVPSRCVDMKYSRSTRLFTLIQSEADPVSETHPLHNAF